MAFERMHTFEDVSPVSTMRTGFERMLTLAHVSPVIAVRRAH